MNSIIYPIVVSLSSIFIISGAFNYGVTRFVTAVPFMFLAFWITNKKMKNSSATYAIVLLSSFSIIFNLNLERFSFMFPVLDNGTITINQDGEHQTFPDGSSGFFVGKSDMKGDLPNLKRKKLFKGEIYRINGVKINHADFGTQVVAHTSVGSFSQRNIDSGEIICNKPLESHFFPDLSILMFYPVLPILFLNSMN